MMHDERVGGNATINLDWLTKPLPNLKAHTMIDGKLLLCWHFRDASVWLRLDQLPQIVAACELAMREQADADIAEAAEDARAEQEDAARE